MLVLSYEGHEEGQCRFKLKAMQEAQQKFKNQDKQKKSQETSHEAFAVEHEMSDFLYTSNNLNELPEMQEFLENMETKVCNHYVILNKQKTQSHPTESTVLKLEVSVLIKSSSFDDLVLKHILLDTGCTKTLIKVNCLPSKYF